MSQKFEFILKSCSTPEQKELLKTIRNLLLQDSRVKEFSKTRHIKYGLNNSKIFAEIIFKKNWKYPKLFLKLPRLDQRYQITQIRCRYAMDINTDGTIPESLDIYQVEKIKNDKNPRRLSRILEVLTQNPIDHINNNELEQLEQLIKLALQIFFQG